jgi:Spy/CpxP family protein refolding chaperone
MISRMIVAAALLLATPALATPALAQPAPPAPPSASADMRGGEHGRGGHRMFPSMSEAGRAIIAQAMLSGDDRDATRQKIEAARERLLAALAADRFDIAAVKRAMDEERAVGEAGRNAKQAAMLAAFQKLSPEDRKAFAADSRAMKERMGKRMKQWRERMRHGHHGDAPPPRPSDAIE